MFIFQHAFPFVVSQWWTAPQVLWVLRSLWGSNQGYHLREVHFPWSLVAVSMGEDMVRYIWCVVFVGSPGFVTMIVFFFSHMKHLLLGHGLIICQADDLVPFETVLVRITHRARAYWRWKIFFSSTDWDGIHGIPKDWSGVPNVSLQWFSTQKWGFNRYKDSYHSYVLQKMNENDLNKIGKLEIGKIYLI